MTVVRRIFVAGFGTGKTDVVDARCSTDLAKHQFDMSGSGAQALEHVQDAIRQVHAAMPDMTFVIEDSVEDGDTIWVRDRDPGYGQGPLLRPTARTDGGDHPGGHRRVAGVCPSVLPS